MLGFFPLTGAPLAAGGETSFIPVSGLQATGGVGSVTLVTDQNISVTGVAATGAVGTVTLKINSVIPIVFLPQAQGEVGDVEITGNAVVTPTGVAGSGAVGNVLVWGRIIPDDDTIWTEIIAA